MSGSLAFGDMAHEYPGRTRQRMRDTEFYEVSTALGHGRREGPANLRRVRFGER